MEKLKSIILLFIFAVFAPQGAAAYDFMVGGLCYNINGDGKSVAITHQNNPDFESSYTSLVGRLTIPSEVSNNGKKYSVTVIGRHAFDGCSDLTSVTIPNSVTNIGKCAFLSCSELTSVTIPNSVTTIGEGAFMYCTGLANVTIPNSVTAISRNVFWGTAWYNNQPDGLVYAGLVAYKYKGTMPNGTTIVLKEGTKGIAGEAFSNCTGLTSVTIPNSVTSIGSGAFHGTAWYNNQPNGLVYAGLVAYKYKGTMPNGTTIVLKEGTKGIAGEAFFGCAGLPSVTIPNSVTNIGDEAFSGCTDLASIVVESGNTKYDSRDNCNGIIETATKTLIVGCKKTTIPNSVTSIGSYAFYGCTGLTNVTIGNSVTSIGRGAFYECTGLTSVTIPNSVTSIGDYAFRACTGLANITIPNSVTSIGSYAFYGCSGLTSVTIPNSVTSIGSYAFYGCTGLASVTIGNSVTSIGDNAFSGCTGLTSVTCLATTPPDVQSDIFDNYNVPSNCKLSVPYGCSQVYKSANYWKDFAKIVELTPSGDVNADNVVDVQDVNIVLNVLLGKTTYVGSDVNGDGVVDIFDINHVINIILNIK